MDHRTCLEAVSAGLDGEATPAERAAADRHLGECAECRDAAEHYAAVTRRVRLRPAQAPPDLVERVLAAVALPAGAVATCGCAASCGCGCQQGAPCRCDHSAA